MLTSQRLMIGKLGEDIARRYLENKGIEILEQDYRTKYGEIDLIGKFEKELIFIEVRTKTNEDFGRPEETLNKKKIAKLKRNALAYSTKIGWQKSIRLDALCIVLNQGKELCRIDHYENIC